jgi:hypothetical protein
VSRAEEIKAELTLERRAQRIIESALRDEKLMADVREAHQLAAAGERGEHWSEVKKRPKIV